MTGQEVYKIFLGKIDKSYSKFIDKTKLNRLFKMALTNLLEKKYLGLTTQKQYDELRFQIKSERVVPIRNNKVSIAPIIVKNVTNNGLMVVVETLTPHNIADGQMVTISGVNGIASVPSINSTLLVNNVPSPTTFTFITSFISGTYIDGGLVTYADMIDDYMHLFSVKCKSKETLRGLKVSNTLSRTPCVITFNKHNNLALGEVIEISNSANASINGVFYYEPLTDVKGKLWYDKEMTQAVMSQDNNVVSGDISRVYYQYAEPLYSDSKISLFNKAKHDNPKVQTADAFLLFTPDCVEISIDYMAKPKYFVDCNDNLFDLEVIYPTKLIYLLIDETILLYTSPSRDTLLNQLTTKEITP